MPSKCLANYSPLKIHSINVRTYNCLGNFETLNLKGHIHGKIQYFLKF